MAHFTTWGKSRAKRLPPSAYREGFPVHVTIGAFKRQPLLLDQRRAPPVFEIIENRPETLVACLMPDHLHWIILPDETSLDVVGRVKSYSTWKCSRWCIEGRIWQRSYFDRVLRSSEELNAATKYIVDNPRRSGLVKSSEAYPFLVVREDRFQFLRAGRVDKG